MKYKCINEIRIGDKVINPGEIVELSQIEYAVLEKNSSLELVENEIKKSKKSKKESEL